MLAVVSDHQDTAPDVVEALTGTRLMASRR
jgi:hypothetical protein